MKFAIQVHHVNIDIIHTQSLSDNRIYMGMYQDQFV